MAGNPKHPSRRQVVETFGAGAVTALAAPSLLTGPACAAGRSVKIGMVSPQTGCIAAPSARPTNGCSGERARRWPTASPSPASNIRSKSFTATVS